MIGIDEIISSYPAAINEEGTRWWPHPGITKYAQRYPELKDYAYWIIEDVHQVRHFVITSEDKIIYTTQQLEALGVHIDILAKLTGKGGYGENENLSLHVKKNMDRKIKGRKEPLHKQ